MEILTEEQAERFHKDGYLKFGRVLNDAQVESLRAALDRTIAEELAREEDADLPPEFAYGHDRKGRPMGDGKSEARVIHQFVNMWKVVPEYREVIYNPTITRAVRDLMGVPHVRLWHDQIISKPPGDNRPFGWHQDFYGWPLDRPTMITCWLALDDATADNGCMHVIPGSHRDPRLRRPTSDFSNEPNLSPLPLGPGAPSSLSDEVRTWGAERGRGVELQAGECMFHHCLNYHMTPQNITDRQRRAFVLIYMPDGTHYNRAQAPQHPCTNYLPLEDGQPLVETEFPLCV